MQRKSRKSAGISVILSFFKLRKKTAGVGVGVMVGGLCLWAIAAWQNLGWANLFSILLGSVLMLGGIVLAAFLLIAGFKFLVSLLGSNTK